MENTKIKFLLNYCKDIPEVYNWVANKLYVEFGISQAVLFLLCSFIVDQYIEYMEREKLINEYRKTGTGKYKKVGADKKIKRDNTKGCFKNNRG